MGIRWPAATGSLPRTRVHDSRTRAGPWLWRCSKTGAPPACSGVTMKHSGRQRLPVARWTSCPSAAGLPEGAIAGRAVTAAHEGRVDRDRLLQGLVRIGLCEQSGATAYAATTATPVLLSSTPITLPCTTATSSPAGQTTA